MLKQCKGKDLVQKELVLRLRYEINVSTFSRDRGEFYVHTSVFSKLFLYTTNEANVGGKAICAWRRAHWNKFERCGSVTNQGFR